MKKKILFISETAPINGIASAVLFYRHLKMLEANGCEINVLMYEAKDKAMLPATWKVKTLSTRKWWYPPYRPNSFLKWIRFVLLYAEARYFIKEAKPDIIIGFLHGIYYSGFAAFLSKLLNKPLSVFYHDRSEKLLYNDNEKMQALTYRHNSYVINQAKVVWTVSPELVYHNPSWKNKFKVVYPIPELIPEKATWKNEFAARPVIGYAGSLYNEVVDVMITIGRELQKINGQLLFMTHLSENVNKIKAELNNVMVVDTRTTAEACAFFAKNASAFIVPYPEDMKLMPWIDSCFPSKFTQFVQTGLPLLVVAPKEAAISRWCVNNNWLAYSNNYDSLNTLLVKVTEEDIWKTMSYQSIMASENDFDQSRIQSSVEQDIEKIVEEISI